MNASEKRRVEELVDAVLMSTCESDVNHLFEVFINCPYLGDAERAMCSEEESTQRDKLRDALQSSLNEEGKGILSDYDDLAGDRFGAEARFYFEVGARLGRLLERQRRAARAES